MIDFHNHILPDVDDGPRLINESLEMLRYASKQGITKVVNTVHFQHPKMDGRNVNSDYLIKQLNILQNITYDSGIDIELYLTAEVFYLPNLVEISSNPILTIGSGRYMLIEFTNNIYPTGYDKVLFNLQMKGITPIIAHPERYRFIQKDIKILEDWVKKGYVIQMDAGSLLGFFGKKVKNISIEIINNSLIHLIGSDAHNNKKRNFCLKEAYDFLGYKYDSKIIVTLKRNAESLLEGKEMELIFVKQNNSLLSKIKSKFTKRMK
jgi:protein-tyrosine phosphatase